MGRLHTFRTAEYGAPKDVLVQDTGVGAEWAAACVYVHKGNGHVVLCYEDGDVYEGWFEKGTRAIDRDGKLTTAAGDVYVPIGQCFLIIS